MVYFIEAVGAGLVKIGFTDGDPMDRLRQLQTGSAHPLRLRHSTTGTQARERSLHLHFAHLRESGEWFRLAVEVEVWMCVDRDYTPVINSFTDQIERLQEELSATKEQQDRINNGMTETFVKVIGWVDALREKFPDLAPPK